MTPTLPVLALAMLHSTAVAPAPSCLDADARERARALMLQGIDEGLKRQTQHVFDNWLKDPSDQPARARRGMRIGITAYTGSRAAVMQWSPPPCRQEP